MDPPASAFENTNYNECDIFPVNEEDKYAVFYENKGQNKCGLVRKTEKEIIDEIRIGRNLEHGPKPVEETVERTELKVVYMDCAGSMVIHDIQEQMKEADVFLFTDVRNLNFQTWEMFAGSDFSVLHMPCFKKSTDCSGYGGITILYRRTVKIVNHARIFTWKLLNTENGKVFPGVEGLFIDVFNGPKVTRICTFFRWKQENSKGFDPRVNVSNFLEHFWTKTIPPTDSLPATVHIVGRFNFQVSDEFIDMLKQKNSHLDVISLDHPDIWALSTDSSLFSKQTTDSHDIFSLQFQL